MCGRFYVDEKLENDLEDILNTAQHNVDTLRCGDIHPSESATLLAGTPNGLALTNMNWGFTSTRDSSLLINARIETVDQKPLFRESVARRRCVIPARSFYEWDRAKNKFTFYREHQKPLFLAGFYTKCKNEDRFIILTTAANASMSRIHDRMPVILDSHELENWCFDERFLTHLQKKEMPSLDRIGYEQLTLPI